MPRYALFFWAELCYLKLILPQSSAQKSRVLPSDTPNMPTSLPAGLHRHVEVVLSSPGKLPHPCQLVTGAWQLLTLKERETEQERVRETYTLKSLF